MPNEPVPEATPLQSVTETPAPPELPPPLESDEILKKLGIGLIEISPGGIITNVDSVTATMLNYANPEDLLKYEGNTKDLIFVDNEAANLSIQQILRDKKPHTFSASLDGPNKRTRALITAYPVFDEKGEVISIRGIVQEIPKVIEAEPTLRIPICGNCKKIRDKNGQWQPVEEFIREHVFGADFSHLAACPACAEKLYGKDLAERMHPPKE